MGLLLSGKLNAYLAGINKQAETVFFQMVDRMAKREVEVVTKQIKVEDQMRWIDEQYPQLGK